MEVITYEIQQQVRVRKYRTDCKKLCDFLRKHKKMASLSNKEIAKTLNMPITKVEHWFRQDSCFSIPDECIWFELKKLLKITNNEFDLAITTFEEKNNVFEKGNRIYDSQGICPTITCLDSLVILDRSNEMEVKVIGQMDNTIDHTFESANRVYDVGGVAPTMNTCGGGGLQPKILESQIVAMRGRNPDNPSDRTVGSTTEQRLETNTQGTSNCLTSVHKDNLVMESQVLTPKRTEYGKQIRKAYESGQIQESRHNMTVLEPRHDGVSNTLTTVQKDNLVMESQVLTPKRTEYGKQIRKAYESGQIQESRHNMTELEPRQDNVSNTLTTVQKDNLLLENNIQKVGQISSNGSQCGTVISDNGISANLVAGTHGYANSHIATQYRIRKLTPRECGRLMGVSDEDIDKMAAVNSNTQLYKQFGNSIVVDVMCAMFKNLNINQ